MPGVIVDIGAGDGSFALKLARDYPDRYIIGIDPNHKALEKTSLVSQPAERKGSLPNLVYVLASIEDLPTELDGIANQVFINFPWAGLMQKLLTADKQAWVNLGRLCQPSALIEIVFSYDATRDAKLELPLINDAFIYVKLAPELKRLGFEILNFTELSNNDLKNYPSTWAKKLAYSKIRTFYHLQVKKT